MRTLSKDLCNKVRTQETHTNTHRRASLHVHNMRQNLHAIRPPQHTPAIPSRDQKLQLHRMWFVILQKSRFRSTREDTSRHQTPRLRDMLEKFHAKEQFGYARKNACWGPGPFMYRL